MKRDHAALALIAVSSIIAICHYSYYGLKPLEWDARWIVMAMYIFGFGTGLWVPADRVDTK